ncbi:MAG: LysR family transcriptional regulator [Oscillospiraceae bacterium]
MTLQQLKYVVEVSKCNTISKAAQSLFLTQPTLSKSIKDLEEELGIKILERGSSKTRFTPQGTELLCYARQLLSQAQEIEKHFSNSEIEKKRFSVSTQHYAFAVKAFISLLQEEQSKDFEFAFRECKTHEIMEDVFTKKSDVGIMFLSDATSRYLGRMFQAKDAEFNELKYFTAHIFVRKNHPLTQFKLVSAKQLEDYTCIDYERDTSAVSLAQSGEVNHAPKRIVYVRDRATCENIIAATDCYAIGTGCLAKGITHENITAVPLEDVSRRMTVGWIRLKSTPVTGLLASYIEKLNETLSQK